MSFFQNHAGLNITSSKLQIVEINYINDQFTLQNVDEEYFVDFFDFSGKETKIISFLQNAFNELVIRKPLNSKYISFTLPGDFFRILELPFDETLTRQDILENFKYDLSILYPDCQSEEYVIQQIELKENSSNKKSKMIVIGIFAKYLRTLHKFCSRNNLKLKYVDNAHIASNNLLTLEKSIQPEEVVLSLYLIDKSISINYLKNSIPFHFEIKEINNLAEIIPIIKENINEISKKKFERMGLRKFFLNGDNFPLSFIDQLEENLDLKAIKLNPFSQMKKSESLVNNAYCVDKYLSFTAAAGIALRII